MKKIKNKLKFLAFVISVNFWFNYLFSAVPLVTDDVYTVDINTYELETTYEILNDSNESKRYLSLTLKSGLTQKIDLGIFTLYQAHPYVEERFESVFCSLKFALLKELLSFTVNNELGKSSCFLNLIFSRGFRNLNFHLNIGYNISEDKTIAGEMFYSCAVEFEYKKFNFVAETTLNNETLKTYLLGFRFNFLDGHFVTFGFENFLDKDNRFIIGVHNEF